jgi:hypothetical protein
MTAYYVLKGKTAVLVSDPLTWARWFEGAGEDRFVAKTAGAEVTVSTVFLGLDHRFSSDGPPILFETLVFGGPHDGTMDRYSTWDEAERGHVAMLARIGALQ